MPDFTIPRDFDYVLTSLPDGTRVYDVYADGKAPLNGGGAPGTRLGRNVGRVHCRPDQTWWATPEVSPVWADLMWFGPLSSRVSAALFLVAMETPHPHYCVSCGQPVIAGGGRLRPLFNRNGSPHSCLLA